jgi:TonB family protein
MVNQFDPDLAKLVFTSKKITAMKCKLPLAVLTGLMFSTGFYAQQSADKKETLPQYKDGGHALYEFINNHLSYPKEALDKKIRGTVLVRITVDKKGNVNSLKVDHSVSPELDQEAMRVVSLIKDKWNPGTTNGKPVETDYSLSVSFVPPAGRDHSGKPTYGTNEYNFNKGMACSKKKDYLNALFYFSDALDSNSSDTNILFYRCLCKIQLGDKLGACDDYKRIKTLQHPNDPGATSKYCQN